MKNNFAIKNISHFGYSDLRCDSIFAESATSEKVIDRFSSAAESRGPVIKHLIVIGTKFHITF